jgi:hypothetical protein
MLICRFSYNVDVGYLGTFLAAKFASVSRVINEGIHVSPPLRTVLDCRAVCCCPVDESSGVTQPNRHYNVLGETLDSSPSPVAL